MDDLSNAIQKKEEQLLHIASHDNRLVDLDNKADVFMIKSEANTFFDYIKKFFGRIGSIALINSSKKENNIVIKRSDFLVDWSSSNGEHDVKSLHNLKTIASNIITQTGYNPLFVSIGTIKWHPNLEETVLSPILIFPVKMVVSGGDGQPIMLEFVEEDAYLNPAFLLKFKLDTGLDDFPSFSLGNIIDYEEFDIDKYFNAIKDYLNEIRTNNSIEFNPDGIFLSKTNTLDICMYNDIKKNKNRILSSNIIKAVFSKNVSLEHKKQENDIDSLDYSVISPVLSFDKSQSLLIEKAINGDSFVIQGPPGTGKSQTITNIISSLLSKNKNVLFVSQKMAALEEVYNKTPEEIRPFLLRLDYEKENLKMDVSRAFNDIKATYKLVSENVDSIDDVKELYDKKDILGRKINALIAELKLRNSLLFSNLSDLNLSMYDLMGLILDNKEEPIKSLINDAKDYSLKQFTSVVDDLSLFDSAYKKLKCKPLLYNSWYGLSDEFYHDQEKISAYMAIGQGLFKVYNTLSENNDIFSTIADFNLLDIRVINNSCLSDDWISSIATNYENPEFRRFIKNVYNEAYNESFSYFSFHFPNLYSFNLERNFFLEVYSLNELKTLERSIDEIFAFLENARGDISTFTVGASDFFNYQEKKENLLELILQNFDISFLEFKTDFNKISDIKKEKYGPFDIKEKRLMENIEPFMKNSFLSHEDVYNALVALDNYQNIQSKLDKLSFSGTRYEDFDLEALRLMVSVPKESLDLIPNEIKRAINFLNGFKAPENEQFDLNELVKHNNVIFKYLNMHQYDAKTFLKGTDSLFCDLTNVLPSVESLVRLFDYLKKDLSKFEKAVAFISSQNITMFLINLSNLLEIDMNSKVSLDQKISLYTFKSFERFLSSLTLDDLKEYTDFRSLTKKDIKNKESWDFIYSFINEGKSTNNPLQVFYKSFYLTLLDSFHFKDAFYRDTLDSKILNLKNAMKELLEVNRKITCIDLKDNIRRKMNDTNTTFNSVCRLKSLRTLFKNKPDEIKNFKRCFMMTPSAIAQLLQTNDYHDFDAVIFDEASQVTPERAISAIYRGKQLIVVGDPKQMSERELFVSNAYDEYYQIQGDELAEQKSILDVINDNENLEMHSLKTHYRSLYENLIKFSNENFYENSLVTFPSLILKGDHIGLVDAYVENGNLDNGKNEVEALRVIEEIKSMLESGKSIGVIAFGESQVDCIWRLIKKDNSLYRTLKDMENENKFFVRALGKVQGHEMDYIILSLTYGLVDGHVNQSFGILNSNIDNDKYGEQCFNVAITRAKESLVLVHSIRSSEIDNKNLDLIKNFIYLVESESEGSLTAYAKTNTKEEAFASSVGDFLETIISNKKRIVYHYGICENSYRIPVAILNETLDKVEFALMLEQQIQSSISVIENYVSYYDMLVVRGFKVYRIYADLWYDNIDIEKENLKNILLENLGGIKDE